MQKIKKIDGDSSTLYAIVLILNLALFFIVLFFFNQILFLLYGYDVKLLHSTSVESFSAYKNIYGSKLPILLFLSGLSIISFFWTIRIAKTFSRWLFISLVLLSGIIALLSITFIVFYFIIPLNVIQ